MALEVLQLSIANTPFQIVAPVLFNRELIFSLPSGQLFIGPTSIVDQMNGFAVPFGPIPTAIPVPLGTELWAVSNVAATNPIKVYVTIADSGLSDAELRATPVPVTGTFQTTHTSLTPLAAANVTVGISSILLVAANPSRKGLRIVVLGGGNIVSLSFDGGPAVANKGVVLKNSNNDVFEMNAFNFTTGAVNAISNGAGTVVAFQEYT